MSAIVRDGGGLSAIEVQAQALDVALRAAAALKGARGLLPEALKSEGEIVAVLLAGQELGLPPMASLRGLQVVRGKVIISYDTMIALLRRASYRIEWTVSTSTEATLRLTAPDDSTHTETWTAERAKKAGLWGSGTWAKYPDAMLRARCVSSAARAFAGEVLAGVYVEEAGEREEIVRAEAPRRREPETVDTHVIEHDEPPAERQRQPSPKRLDATRDADGLRAWVDAYWPEYRVARGETAGDRVLAQAKAIGVDPETVTGWLAAATPAGEVAP